MLGQCLYIILAIHAPSVDLPFSGENLCLTNVILLQSDFDSFIDSDIITGHTPELLQLPIFDLLVFTVPLPSAIRQQCGARVQGAWPVLRRSLRDLRGHHFRLKQDEVCFKNWVVFFTLLLVVWTAQRRVSLSRKRWKKVMISKHACVLRQFREVRVYSSHSRVLATVKSWINHQNTQDFQGGHRADWILHFAAWTPFSISLKSPGSH